VGVDIVRFMLLGPASIQLMGLEVDVTDVPEHAAEAVTSYATTVLLAGTVAVHVPV
jgi:hypothetical protein